MQDDRPPLQIGLLLPTREAMLGGESLARPLIDLAVFAEGAGFDSVWAGDSLLARPRLDPLFLLSAIAARTEALTLGTAVYLPALRHPVLFAHTVATLDRIAEGRLVLGVGAGFGYPATEAEFTAAGVPFNQRVGRLVETVEISRRLWSAQPGDAVSFDGRYWSLSDVDLEPKPHRPEGPPVWLAGATERSLARAGRLFDGWLPYPPTPEEFTSGWDQVQAAAVDAGRDPAGVARTIYVTVSLDEDADRARADLERYVDAYYGFPLDVMSQLQGFFGGDVAGCVEWLRRYVDRGADHIILRLGTLEGALPAAELVADRLLSELRRAVSGPVAADDVAKRG